MLENKPPITNLQSPSPVANAVPTIVYSSDRSDPISPVDREIRAARHTTPRDFSSFSRVYRRLSYILLAREGGRVESVGDYLEAMKCACAAARIPYSGDAIWTATRHVIAPALPRLLGHAIARSQPADGEGLSRARAANIYGRLEALRRRREGPVAEALHDMPTGQRPLRASPALQQITGLMVDSIRRCRALERQVQQERG